MAHIDTLDETAIANGWDIKAGDNRVARIYLKGEWRLSVIFGANSGNVTLASVRQFSPGHPEFSTETLNRAKRTIILDILASV